LDTVSIPAPTGQSLVVGGGQWNVLERRSAVAIANLAAADTLLGLPTGDAAILSEAVGSASVINYHGTGNSGHFGNDNPYLGGNGDRIAMRITGKIEVVQAGEITFGFFANDGGRGASIGSRWTIFTASCKTIRCRSARLWEWGRWKGSSKAFALRLGRPSIAM